MHQRGRSAEHPVPASRARGRRGAWLGPVVALIPFATCVSGNGGAGRREATGSEASTLHRLLEFNAQTRQFDRNRERPLHCDLLIVDEASMLDTVLAHHVLKAVPDHGRLILVGDVDQLPSVGCDHLRLLRPPRVALSGASRSPHVLL